MANLEPVIGHEQGRQRPVAVLSRDPLGRSGLAIVAPFTTKDVGSPLHLRVDPPEGGLSEVSFALPQHVRSISPTRFTKRLGTIRPQTRAERDWSVKSPLTSIAGRHGRQQTM
jgi:mRNA interferase MazF